MNIPEVKIEQLQWQLDVMAGLEPEILGRTIQEYDYYISTEPEHWADEVLEFFTYRCFEGFGSFLEKIEQQYRTANRSIGAMEAEIFSHWQELSEIDDDELFLSATRTGVLVKFFPEDRSVKIDSFQRKEWRRKLFNPFDLYDLGRKGTGNPERESHLTRVVRQLSKSGPYRRYTFDQQAIKSLSGLKETSPNFAEVTDRVIDAVNLATAYSKPIRITPILLVGQPGIGKSHYTQQLSRCLGVPIKIVAVDNLQEGSDLAGSSFVYYNSQPGEVFRVLAEQDHLSPLVILDELDKASFSFSGDTLSPLHNLLEPVSAKQFRDGSIGLPIDASSVIWIATANYLSRIPPTLKSRFEIFEISQQHHDAKAAILKGLCNELQREYPDIEFSDKVSDALVNKTPREQRQLLERALARAVRVGEAIVSLDHLEQVAPQAKPKPHRANGYL